RENGGGALLFGNGGNGGNAGAGLVSGFGGIGGAAGLLFGAKGLDGSR
ncbi:PE-PGRS family protein, partial [Mycobacterium kansasii]